MGEARQAGVPMHGNWNRPAERVDPGSPACMDAAMDVMAHLSQW
jgi:hypothetical protein